MIRTAFMRPVVLAAKKTPDNKGISLLALRYHTSNATRQANSSNYLCTPLFARSLVAQCRQGPLKSQLIKAEPRACTIRSNSQKASSEKAAGVKDGEEPMSQEIVLTPGEKVVVGTRLFFWAGAFAFASVCAFYIGKELIPTKMSPNNVFDKATDVIRTNEEVKRRFGESFKTYGRDHGGHREGRRNFIEHTEYVNQEDGSKRTRVRFNLEGPYGQAFVFAEVSKDMPSGEFVYILVQDKRNGAVVNVVDNRSALLAKQMAGGNEEGMTALSNLLGGGKK